jgi:hypothetical protein
MVDDARGPDEKVQDEDPVVTRWVIINAFFQIHIVGTVKPTAARGSSLVTRVLLLEILISSGQLILWKF